MNTTLPICTVGYLVRGERGREEIWLGTKAPTPKAIKRKIAGKLIGYGGDFEEDKDLSVRDSFKRELAEESGFRANTNDIEVLAQILIKDENGPRLILNFLFVRAWTGHPGVNGEIIDPRWYPARPLPETVLEADKLILPPLFDGKKLTGWVEYDKDMNIVGHELTEVEFV
jgi:hypothetical protein